MLEIGVSVAANFPLVVSYKVSRKIVIWKPFPPLLKRYCSNFTLLSFFSSSIFGKLLNHYDTNIKVIDYWYTKLIFDMVTIKRKRLATYLLWVMRQWNITRYFTKYWQQELAEPEITHPKWRQNGDKQQRLNRCRCQDQKQNFSRNVATWAAQKFQLVDVETFSPRSIGGIKKVICLTPLRACKKKRWPGREDVIAIKPIWFYSLWTERSISRRSVKRSLNSDGKCSITARCKITF